MIIINVILCISVCMFARSRLSCVSATAKKRFGAPRARIFACGFLLRDAFVRRGCCVAAIIVETLHFSLFVGLVVATPGSSSEAPRKLHPDRFARRGAVFEKKTRANIRARGVQTRFFAAAKKSAVHREPFGELAPAAPAPARARAETVKPNAPPGARVIEKVLKINTVIHETHRKR